MASIRTWLRTALVVPLVAGGLAAAHDWAELDARRALAEADAVVAVAEAVQRAWAPTPGAADVPAGAPPALRWWTWLQAQRLERGDDAVVQAIAAHAPAWLDDGDAAEAVADWWANAVGELLAHAAARDVDDAERAAAMDDLRRRDLPADAAARASWVALLPVLTDVERRDLAPAFARLDALVAEGTR